MRARQRLIRDLDVEGELLGLVQDACGFRTDTEMAAFLGVARNALSNVRTGRASLEPRPRQRILNRFAPFDTAWVDAVLDSTGALIDAVREWMDRQGNEKEGGRDTP